MIFLHLLLGILLGKIFGNYLFFIIGSVFPDIDHLYILIKNKVPIKKVIDSIKFEEKYKLRYKTALFHSLLGLSIFSSIILLINWKGTLIFATAYFLHLLIDWLDIDEKYYLYPFKIKFKGILPIWSKAEQILTLAILIILLITIIL